MKEQFEEKGNGLLVRAPAKLNLSLLIAGRCRDGYHEIETVMAKTDLYDELFFEQGQKPGIELLCRGRFEVPCGADNLVYKACQLICRRAGADLAVKVTLTKNIPVGSGLGGASSDAAAALMGLNIFAKLGFSTEEMIEMASVLGSDTAFFLGSSLAFCTGRGEKIRKIDGCFDFGALLVFPGVNVSTKRVYENYRHDNNLYEQFSGPINTLIEKKNIDLLAKMCANMLRISCFQLYPELADLKNRLDVIGIGDFCLSGSGSTLYLLIAGSAPELAGYQSMLRGCVDCESIVVHSNRW